MTQTTLAVDQTRRVIDVLKARFPHLMEPHSQDICYATQNRQDAVRVLAQTCEIILVIGAPHSSNSVRLCEVAESAGIVAREVEIALLDHLVKDQKPLQRKTLSHYLTKIARLGGGATVGAKIVGN